MQVQFTFKQMPPSQAVKDYITDKLDRLEKYDIAPGDLHAILSVEKFNRVAELSCTSRGIHFRSLESSEDMFTSIDMAVDKLERQLRKHKEKVKNDKRK